jgi:hypothetical protein
MIVLHIIHLYACCRLKKLFLLAEFFCPEQRTAFKGDDPLRHLGQQYKGPPFLLTLLIKYCIF